MSHTPKPRANQRCEALTYFGQGIAPGTQCMWNGEPHRCGFVMCWTHRTRFNDGGLVRFVQPLPKSEIAL